jgi:hypothetical protein
VPIKAVVSHDALVVDEHNCISILLQAANNQLPLFMQHFIVSLLTNKASTATSSMISNSTSDDNTSSHS